MTDNRTDTQNASNEKGTKLETKPADKSASSVNKDNKAADNSANKSASTKPATPQIKKLDIVIAGTTYAIFCPADEEDELRAAENYLNTFASNIKKDAPNLNQENLLVLSCLNLYEKINAHKTSESERQQQSKQNEQLLNKIMQEAHSIL